MKTNVSTLLREFPRIRRAALAGEDVVVVTREGDLRITAEPTTGSAAIGSLRHLIKRCDDSIDSPTTADTDWDPSL